ncbi:Aquaporin NIP3-1 [Hibiscus syriacus]|uniref:Aquaporin NIP3-1 n=1 Tax=Hibiscus syriacus TaxID=106335 RepID=A0A6A3B1K6_HIBSY|nr:Aquaporin NIP3-1 [Hibiscus syriacus]
MENKDVPLAPSTPATPGTPGAPLFGGVRENQRVGINRKSLLKSCKCFNVEEWSMEEGRLPPVSCSLPPPSVSLTRKVGAVFIVTFILIFSGTATAIVNKKTQGSETLIGVAASTGLAVMIVILSTVHISGAHLNPAITIAFAALKHFPWKHVPVYIGVQVMALLCAAFALKGKFDASIRIRSGPGQIRSGHFQVDLTHSSGSGRVTFSSDRCQFRSKQFRSGADKDQVNLGSDGLQADLIQIR